MTKPFTVTKKTKLDRIREAIINLLNQNQSDWNQIRKAVLSDKSLKAFPAEFKKIEKALVEENIIKFD